MSKPLCARCNSSPIVTRYYGQHAKRFPFCWACKTPADKPYHGWGDRYPKTKTQLEERRTAKELFKLSYFKDPKNRKVSEGLPPAYKAHARKMIAKAYEHYDSEKAQERVSAHLSRQYRQQWTKIIQGFTADYYRVYYCRVPSYRRAMLDALDPIRYRFKLIRHIAGVSPLKDTPRALTDVGANTWHYYLSEQDIKNILEVNARHFKENPDSRAKPLLFPKNIPARTEEQMASYLREPKTKKSKRVDGQSQYPIYYPNQTNTLKKTANLTGPALHYALALAYGTPVTVIPQRDQLARVATLRGQEYTPPDYRTLQDIELLEDLTAPPERRFEASLVPQFTSTATYKQIITHGHTPQEAVYRAYVRHNAGDRVSIPNALLPLQAQNLL